MGVVPIVKPVSITSDQLQMLVPPFIDQFGDEEDLALARALLRITKETRVLLGQFFLYSAMSRSKEFGAACRDSNAREGRGIVLGSLLRSMVVSAAALFDDNPRTSNIPATLRIALSPARASFLRKFHAHYDVETQWIAASSRLVKYSRSLRKGQLREATRALVEVRNTFVAHFDMHPELRGRRAIIRDLDHVISAASVIVYEANIYVLGRSVDKPELRKLLRREANGFVETLRRGFMPRDIE